MSSRGKKYRCELPISLRLIVCAKIKADRACLKADEGRICSHLVFPAKAITRSVDSS